MHDHTWFLYLAGVPFLGVAAQWLAWRLRLPSILLLLGFGIGLGAYCSPDEILQELAHGEPGFAAELLFPIVSLAVAVILFEGGLSLRLSELNESGGVVLRLVTIGAAVSWGLTAVAAHLVLGLDLRVAALIGAILIVTGPTVVGPLLRHVRPAKRIGSVVKWEGIVIDPIGAVLAVLVFEQVFSGDKLSLTHAGAMLSKTILIGVGIGLCTGWVLVRLVKRFWIPDFLHGVTFLGAALAVFAVSNVLQEESGLVTVTVLGVFVANQKEVDLRHVTEFKEHLQIFLISCLFIVLGSRLDPSDLGNLGWGGIGFLALLILVIRPLSVFAAMLGSRLNWQERWFLAFLAPRGIVAAAVSSVFGLKLASLSQHSSDFAGPLAESAQQLDSIAFLVIIGTVATYGLAAAPLARRLQLADPNPQGLLIAGCEPWIREMARLLHESGYAVMLVDTNFAHVAAARMEGLSAECSSILSEHVREDIDLAGIGRMLALTPNDEVNTLAVGEFAHLFGRQHVYQLAPSDRGSGHRESVAEHLRGRILFGEDVDHALLAERIRTGKLKRTQLTDEFLYEDFAERYGDSAIVLFIESPEKQLRVRSLSSTTEPQVGDTLIAIVQEPEPVANRTSGSE